MPSFDDNAEITSGNATYDRQELQAIREKAIHQQRRLEVLGEWWYLAIITQIVYRQWPHFSYDQVDVC